jgi:hypothetical protein
MMVVGTLALALLAGIAQAASKSDAFKVQPGTVVGLVSDVAGKSQAGVTVRMSGEGRVMEAVTDKAGSFALKNVVAGRYDLYVGGAQPAKVVATTDAASGLLYVVVPGQNSNAAMGGLGLGLLIVGGTGAAVGGSMVAANNGWIGGWYVNRFLNPTFNQHYDGQKVTP